MAQTKDRKDNGKKYVLVLDENFTFRYFLLKGLRAQGYECVEARDYHCAQSYLKKNTFDIVLADFRTFMNGKLSSPSNGSRPQNDTPTIFLIGQATEKAMETAKNLGARAIFEKRGDLDELLKNISMILSSEIRKSKE